MLRPLNPTLYHLLAERFGSVVIANAGIQQLSVYRRHPLKNENVLDIIEPGEYYRVSCCYCNDTRHRLYVNHRWGVRDEQGRCNLWLAICYNENCMTFERRGQLWEDLTALGGPRLHRARLRPGMVVEPSLMAMEWPGPVTRVDRLPHDHPAVQYLRQRSFDPEKIGRFYNVHYCHDSFRWLAKGRLIIPIYENKVLQGWQGRYVGELPWHDKQKAKELPPKYYSAPGMPRRHLVYNLANASQYRTGVIVEGPTDVWSFGPMAVCTLGATMTPHQQKKFVSRFRDYSAVLLYDADVWERPESKRSVEKLIDSLSGRFKQGFAVVKLPAGRDPGSMDREFLREFVADEARKAGVKVSWKKR